MHEPNQRNGNESYETCDDGGDDSDPAGLACSADCQTIEEGWECLEWGAPCTLKCGNGHVEGFLTPEVDTDGNKVDDGSGNDVLIFEYELLANGDIAEECDFGVSMNSALTAAEILALGDAGYDEIYLRPCTADCKLIEDLFTSHATFGAYEKWDCEVNVAPTDWPKPYNMTKVVHEMTCTYKCGNRVFDDTESCDIGGWAFTGMQGGDEGSGATT